MADGYPIEAQTANYIERAAQGRSRAVAGLATHHSSPNAGRHGARSRARSSASPTSRRRCASWSRPRSQALAAGADRKEAILAAYDRFYRGDIAKELRGAACARRAGSSRERISPSWKVHIEEPVSTSYKGIEVYKLTRVDAGPGDAAGAQHPRELRPEGDGLQQHALHPHGVPGDEPRLRRPRLLLRRRLPAAGGAGPRAALEGLRARPREAHRSGAQRSRRPRPAIRIPFQGAKQPVPRPARSAGTSRATKGPRQRRHADGAPTTPTSSAPSTPARPRSSRPTRKAGWCR